MRMERGNVELKYFVSYTNLTIGFIDFYIEGLG